MRKQIMIAILSLFGFHPVAVGAEAVVVPVPNQYIAALSAPDANSGTGAEDWGLWAVDPGPRGVRLSKYQSLVDAAGVAPAGWTFDNQSWWLDENGLLMEPPVFPLPAGRYLVTGARTTLAELTVDAADAEGRQTWSLSDGATIYDVTHLRCRAAHYVPKAEGQSCSPQEVNPAYTPMVLGAPMPQVQGCQSLEYQVLIIVGMVVEK